MGRRMVKNNVVRDNQKNKKSLPPLATLLNHPKPDEMTKPHNNEGPPSTKDNLKSAMTISKRDLLIEEISEGNKETCKVIVKQTSQSTSLIKDLKIQLEQA